MVGSVEIGPRGRKTGEHLLQEVVVDLEIRVRDRVLDLNVGGGGGVAVLEVLEGCPVEGGGHGLLFSAAGLHGYRVKVRFQGGMED